MGSERVIVAVYWDARQARLDEATDLLLNAFEGLAKSGYDSWRLKGRTRKQPGEKSFVPTSESVTSLLARGVNRTDIGKHLIPEMGYSFGCWSGGPDESAYAFSGNIGNATNIGKNCLLLELPRIGPLSYESNKISALFLFKKLIFLSNANQGIVCKSTEIAWENGRLSQSISSQARYG
jgi:hypothetical protein